MNTRSIESNTESLPKLEQSNGTETLFPGVEVKALAPCRQDPPGPAPAQCLDDCDANAQVINVLVIDDCEDDLISRLAELEQRGYVPLHCRVETREEFLAALKSRSWDAVISEHVLPEFSGPEALKLLRDQGLDTPFIMASDIFGEEKAAMMMKAGANDYLAMENLCRLVPVLERELKAARDRRGYKRLLVAVQHLAEVFRELQEVAERTVGKRSGKEMPEPQHPGPIASATAPSLSGPVTVMAGSSGKFPTLGELERQHIFAALDRCQGNRSAAAALLDISVRTLRNKLHKYRGTLPRPGSQPQNRADGNTAPVSAELTVNKETPSTNTGPPCSPMTGGKSSKPSSKRSSSARRIST